MGKRDIQKELGMNLQRARAQRKMTREELAEKAGISTTFLANLECGNKMMSVVTLLKLAEVLCVSTDTLLYGENADTALGDLEALLRNQPAEMIKFIEELAHLSVTRIPAIPLDAELSRNSREEVSTDVDA